MPAAPRKLWNRAECDWLSSSGLLNGQHLELIEGELIDKMGRKRPHVNSVALLLEWLTGVFEARCVLQEAPIDVAPEDNPTSEPEPDLIVLKRDFSQFTEENPRPEDLRLVIEVAYTTVGFDATSKAALYARAGIVDYWALDFLGSVRQLPCHVLYGFMWRTHFCVQWRDSSRHNPGCGTSAAAAR